jgi:ferritin-like metal-binding protein YciE
MEAAMAETGDHLMDWLRDAHAMEMQAIKMLEAQIARIENYPLLHARLSDHLDQTRRQAERIHGCIERRGGERSALKDTTARLTAMMQGLGGAFVEDEVVKGAMASYTFEHFEIAAYRALIAAADAAGDAETRRVCQEILDEEAEMADWLDEHLPIVTRQYLERDLVGAEAKR